MAVRSKNPKDIIKKTTEELLKNLQVEAKIDVTEEETGFMVNINTTETGLLIGYHGEVVNSLQVLLGVIVYKKLNKWVRVVVDVGDYRKRREEAIKRMVEKGLEEAIVTKQDVILPHLSPLERRIVHVTLATHPEAYSQSEGEGKDRHVVIKLRQK